MTPERAPTPPARATPARASLRPPACARIPTVVACIALASCQSIHPGEGFDQVESTALERTGARIHWDSGTPEDEQVRASVRDLLSRPLTPDAAVQIALLNNRALQGEYERLSIAQAEVVRAGLLHNPIFDAQVRLATSGGTLLDLSVAQDFLSLLTIPLRRARAEREFEAEKARVSMAVLDVAGAARERFVMAQAAARQASLRATAAEADGVSYDLTRAIYEAGNITELELLRSRAMFERARLSQHDAEAAALAARESLNEVMGAWGEQTAWTIDPSLPDVPAGDTLGADAARVEQEAIRVSLELEAGRREFAAAAKDLGLADPFSWLTELEGGVTSEREFDGAWSIGPSLTLPIPLLDQGQAARAAAQARLRQLGARHWQQAVAIRSRARAAAAALVAARERAEYERQVVLPLHARIVEQSQIQYNAMQIGGPDLIAARREELAAQGEYARSLEQYWIARGRLETILAGGIASSDAAPTHASSWESATPQGGGH